MKKDNSDLKSGIKAVFRRATTEIDYLPKKALKLQSQLIRKGPIGTARAIRKEISNHSKPNRDHSYLSVAFRQYEPWIAINEYRAGLFDRHDKPKIPVHRICLDLKTRANLEIDNPAKEYVVFLDRKDILRAGALPIIADFAVDSNFPEVIYWDEDELAANGKRVHPFFKPEWSPEFFHHFNYIGHAFAVRADQLPFIDEYSDSGFVQFFLEHIEKPKRAEHLKLILSHKRTKFKRAGEIPNPGASHEFSKSSARPALQAYLDKLGPGATVNAHPDDPNLNRVVYSNNWFSPEITVIICAKNKYWITRRAISGVLNKTDYPNLKLIVVDHQSTDLLLKRYFNKITKDSRVRILRYEGPFNFSDMNNLAVGESKSNFICFLNNDTEIIHSDWLTQLAGPLKNKNVAASGAKLLFPDKTIQHAGVVIGMSNIAGHQFIGVPHNDRTVPARRILHAIRNVSAVTAACMLVRNSDFLAVGGFDSENLAVAYNDVDLCLKIRKLGKRIVYQPGATLYHYESKSRGSDQSPKRRRAYELECNFIRKKWDIEHLVDPYHHPNLTLAPGLYDLELNPIDHID